MKTKRPHPFGKTPEEMHKNSRRFDAEAHPAEFKFMHEDHDNCRVYYRKPATGLVYCLQDEATFNRAALAFYVCSADGEPQTKIELPLPGSFDRFISPIR